MKITKNELNKMINESVQTKLNEAEKILANSWAVVLKGGLIGEKSIRNVRALKGLPVVDTKHTYQTYEEAVNYKKQMNKLLSPGEKKYYGLLYIVAGIKDGIFTGKGK